MSARSFSEQTWNWLSLSWGIFQVSRSDTFICGCYIIFVIYCPIWLPVILNPNCKSSNQMDFIQNDIECFKISPTRPWFPSGPNNAVTESMSLIQSDHMEYICMNHQISWLVYETHDIWWFLQSCDCINDFDSESMISDRPPSDPVPTLTRSAYQIHYRTFPEK